MTRYWLIAPYDSREKQGFERVWEYDLKKGVIAIGWRLLGDVSGLSEEQVRAKVKEVYGDKNAPWRFRIIRQFYYEIEPGDVVVARRGRKTIAAVGTVIGKAFYNEEMGRERGGSPTEGFYSNFIRVQWLDDNRDIAFDRIVFPIQTLYPYTEEKVRSLIAEEPTSR